MLYLDEDQFFNQEAESKRAGNNDSGSNLPTGYQGYQTLSAGLTEPTQAPILLPNYASGYAPNQQSVSETLNYHLDQINLLTSESQTLANHNALNQPIEFMQQENFVETNNGNFPQEENTVFSPQPAQEPFAFDGSIQPNDIGLQSANQASFSSNAPQLYGYLPMQQVPPEFLGELYANQPSDYAPQNGTNGNVLSAPDQNESVPDNPLIDTNTTEPGKPNQKSGVDSTDAKDAGQNSGDDQYTSEKPEDTLPKSCDGNNSKDESLLNQIFRKMSVQTYFDGGYTNYEVNLSAVEKERKVITDKNGVATSEEIVIKKSRIGQTTCGEQYLIEKRTTIRTPRTTVLKSCETQPNELNISSEVEQSASCDQISESESKCEVEPSEKAPTDKVGETVSESKQNVNCKVSIDKVNRAVSRPSLNFSHILLKNLPQDEAQQTGLNCQDNLTSENAVNSSGVGTDPVKPQKTNLLNQGSSFSYHDNQTSKNHPSERLLRGNQISDIIITKNSGTQCNLPPPKKVSHHSADSSSKKRFKSEPSTEKNLERRQEYLQQQQHQRLSLEINEEGCLMNVTMTHNSQEKHVKNCTIKERLAIDRKVPSRQSKDAEVIQPKIRPPKMKQPFEVWHSDTEEAEVIGDIDSEFSFNVLPVADHSKKDTSGSCIRSPANPSVDSKMYGRNNQLRL